MPVEIYYLRFTSPVRWGSDHDRGSLDRAAFTCHSDTLFSAICNEWMKTNGEASLEKLFSSVHDNQFRISDLLPYKEKKCYLPKPDGLYLKKTIPPETFKQVKKLDYLSLEDFEQYLMEIFSADTSLSTYTKPRFVLDYSNTKVNTKGAHSRPYLVSAYEFLENAGLYFMIDIPENLKAEFQQVMESLQTTGMGGKRSIGYGQFDVERHVETETAASETEKILYRRISEEAGPFMNLSLVLPKPEEVKKILDEDCYISLLERKGFVQPIGLKRKSVTMIQTGSILKEKIEGTLVNVSPDQNKEDQDIPKVYRYGKGFYLGLGI